jgi:fructose-bisphosphate aldolase, class II
LKAKELLAKADEEHFAIGAFNAANIETIKAVTNAAAELKAPIIIEASDGEINHVGIQQMVALVRTYEQQLGIPIILNLDHGKDVEMCTKAINAGFDYVHLDCGKLSFEEAVTNTKKVVALAHKKGVIVEGEIDHIEGSSADHTNERTEDVSNPKLYTDPLKAKEFVEKTGIDVFASFVGNMHGIYATAKRLNLEILKKIKELLPNTYLSLHGGSGIVEEDIKGAIKLGIVKVNVNSELRIAFKMTLQTALNSSNEIAAYKFMEQPIKEVQKVVETKIKMFGSAGKIL